ncbi:MAG: alanine racemase protein, partial [Sphingomonas bacterium]|nr:alanine racemase protein [Sphingomonas bacterium]
GRLHLARIVGGGGAEQGPRGTLQAAAVDPVRAPGHGIARRTAEHQDKPPRAGDSLHRAEQAPPDRGIAMVMTEDDARSTRQRGQRRPEGVALPLVGHQPEIRHGLASGHSAAYSTAMSVSDPEPATFASPLEEVRARIVRSAVLAGRDPAAIELIAISKTHPMPAIQPLLDAGQLSFGENRVQEAQDKWPGAIANDRRIRLHLVGQLQSNKADAAVALFDAIHSVDRPSLIDALARASERAGRRPECFVQVNIGEEPQKGGCAIAELPALLAQAGRAGLPVAGLMCVPPADTEAAPYFALLAKLARDNGVAGLSMGMSGDYETAVLIGATHIRVGSALFGQRG